MTTPRFCESNIPVAFIEGTSIDVLASGESVPDAGDTVNHGADGVAVNFIVWAPAVSEHEMGIS